MTRSDALGLLKAYGERVERILQAASWRTRTVPEAMVDVRFMYSRFPHMDGSKAKAMRWLGYMQGVLVTSGFYTLTEVKQHSKDKAL